ncbi:MAG: HPr(Ser) kinase/phosphatase [Ruminococcaceae bacterium]|nr:HPr(Ser) kinase/phosphatase [Oscillospiraceae bacterium]
MEDKYYVPLTTLVRDHDLEVVYAASDYASIQLTVEDVSRPGIQLAGYFDHFEPLRLQVMGNVEMGYLRQMPQAQQMQVLDRLFSYKFPALLLARGMEPGEAFLEIARKHDVTVLRTQEPTSTTISTIITYLRAALAPRITRHGVLMEVYGEGILLTGESGMGKSETAVELLKRGHRLIADDAVEIRKIASDVLIGTAPAVIRNYVELRGIGIINVARLFGMGAIKAEKQINLVVNIVPWDNHASYDRMGMEVEYVDILGVKIPMNTIPITPGRNLAVILEVAAMNNRQRKMGYNAALEFTEQLNRQFETNKG